MDAIESMITEIGEDGTTPDSLREAGISFRERDAGSDQMSLLPLIDCK